MWGSNVAQNPATSGEAVAPRHNTQGKWKCRVGGTISSVLILLGAGSFAAAGIGFAVYGAHHGWWSVGSLSDLSQVKAMIMMAAGTGGGITFLTIGIIGLVKSLQKQHLICDIILDGSFDEEPTLESGNKELEKVFANRSFKFRTLPGFACKARADGYLTADNTIYNPESPIRMAKSTLLGQLNSPDIKKSDLEERNIALAAQEYKIHLMPQEKHMEDVVLRLLERFESDEQLQQCLAQYKVMLGVEGEDGRVSLPISTVEKKHPDDPDMYKPRIVLYTEDKTSAQTILDAVCELFPDAETLGESLLLEDNTRVNRLIAYAHGSSGMKSRARERGFELFIESFSGEYDLLVPQ